jgi:hypothetical protein
MVTTKLQWLCRRGLTAVQVDAHNRAGCPVVASNYSSRLRDGRREPGMGTWKCDAALPAGGCALPMGSLRVCPGVSH